MQKQRSADRFIRKYDSFIKNLQDNVIECLKSGIYKNYIIEIGKIIKTLILCNCYWEKR